MKKLILTASLLAAFGASAHEVTYSITTTWYEPDTQPKNTIFQGSFDFDEHTGTVSNLHGMLSESMTGSNASDMTWLTLSNQLVTWYDASLGGTFAAAFKNPTTATFWTGIGGDGWSPQAGIAVGGVYNGFPVAGNNPGNAYALIFVPDDPTAALTQAQIDKLAYADCAPGGMMMAACMTGTSEAGYGAVGTMSGYPLSQTITLAQAVPEPGTYAMLLAGIGLMGLKLRRRQG
jgi:PEP-CTERM motif